MSRPPTEEERERIRCLVQQGYTPSLARNVVLARSREYLPLTIWIVDNSSSMNTKDGRRLLPTASQNDVRVMPCTRWEELKETVVYHAQLAALLNAPTKFILLNRPVQPGSMNFSSCPQEMTIAERGTEWIDDDMEDFVDNFSHIQPQGVTPLSDHLRRIYQSLLHMENKIVLVLATDGKPTDPFGYSSPAVDREFENALRQVQSKAWVVIRLCTNDDSVLSYYQKLDDQEEFSLEVLDDYLDEAKEIYSYNSWLTYSLSLHRCREMGMSCHSTFRFMDWLDERSLSRDEIVHALTTLGLVAAEDRSSHTSHTLLDDGEWKKFCSMVAKEQVHLASQKHEAGETRLEAFTPWNPIKKRTTPLVDVW
eukprot:CAMPEP_0178838690 /NCGR_PEP_ID=MMETSP0746-20121128/13456_1 /TAXON_ID=913974 /ORGANISM="Nitzschia punctata, Strain CCMP561" /LENGTH=365 /DNA_ID=CAMNT_0020501671 /DNA_START=94 /DNA_END=1188 /DNA_ORIENTATION=+